MKTMNTWLATSVAALSTLLCPALAHADYLTATLGQPLFETAHFVEVKISKGVATLVVQRTFENAGTLEEEASLDIDLPVGAVATGLRIKSGDTWYSGDLMDKEEAAKLYLELTGKGPYEPKDPALLQWIRLGVLHLQVFPIFPGKQSTVEYTFTVPTEYIEGRYFVSYPTQSATSNLVAPTFRFVGEESGVLAFLDGEPAALETNVSPPSSLPTELPEARTQVEMQSDVTRVSSKLNITKKGALSKATVHINIKHTYRGDLRVVLRSPSGKETILHEREGQDKNDLIGAYPVELSKNEEASGEWKLIVEDHAAVDVGTLQSWKLEAIYQSGEKKTFSAKDVPVFLPDTARSDEGGSGWLSAGYHQLSVSAPRIDTLVGRIGKANLTKEKSIYRVELDTAAQLRPMPQNLSVVFVVDASYSQKEEGLSAQLGVAKAFLSHVPDATFEVVLFRRFAERLNGSFQGAPQFEKTIEKAKKANKLSLGNGSALDEGIALASKALNTQKGPTMIVVLTDTMLRSRFENKLALEALKAAPKGTTLHIVQRQPGDEVTDKRDDTAPLAPIAAAQGGIFLHLLAPLDASHEELAPLALGLIRPIRIDQVLLESESDEIHNQLATPNPFYEGEGIRQMFFAENAPEKIVITGKLWQETFRREITAEKSFSQKTAAFVFSSDLYQALSEKEQKKLAYMGQAVSPVTSYIAVEPGVRPSTAGIERNMFGRGAGSFGSRVSVGALYCIGAPQLPDLASLVKSEPCFQKYPKPQDWKATIQVETTFDEIVDVIADTNDPLSSCLVEAAWQVRLNEDFYFEKKMFTLSY